MRFSRPAHPVAKRHPRGIGHGFFLAPASRQQFIQDGHKYVAAVAKFAAFICGNGGINVVRILLNRPKPTDKSAAGHVGLYKICDVCQGERLASVYLGVKPAHKFYQNANSKCAVYQDLLNIVMYATMKNAEDFRRGIEMTLISYATAIMAREEVGSPNYELLQKALKAIKRDEKVPKSPDEV